jgi:hypothetical protein
MSEKTNREKAAAALERAAKAIRDGCERNIEWWSYATCDGWDCDGGADDAAARAESMTDFAEVGDGDEWPEDMHLVCWAVMVPVEMAIQVNRVETPPGPTDYTCDYVLASATLSTLPPQNDDE